MSKPHNVSVLFRPRSWVFTTRAVCWICWICLVDVHGIRYHPKTLPFLVTSFMFLYGDFHEWGTPKSSIFIGLSIKNNHVIDGNPHFVQYPRKLSGKRLGCLRCYAAAAQSKRGISCVISASAAQALRSCCHSMGQLGHFG